MNLKLSRTALRELTRLYRGVLVAAMISAAFVASGAKADDGYNLVDGDNIILEANKTITNTVDTEATGRKAGILASGGTSSISTGENTLTVNANGAGARNYIFNTETNGTDFTFNGNLDATITGTGSEDNRGLRQNAASTTTAWNGNIDIDVTSENGNAIGVESWYANSTTTFTGSLTDISTKANDSAGNSLGGQLYGANGAKIYFNATQTNITAEGSQNAQGLIAHQGDFYVNGNANITAKNGTVTTRAININCDAGNPYASTVSMQGDTATLNAISDEGYAATIGVLSSGTPGVFSSEVSDLTVNSTSASTYAQGLTSQYGGNINLAEGTNTTVIATGATSAYGVVSQEGWGYPGHFTSHGNLTSLALGSTQAIGAYVSNDSSFTADQLTSTGTATADGGLGIGALINDSADVVIGSAGKTSYLKGVATGDTGVALGLLAQQSDTGSSSATLKGTMTAEGATAGIMNSGAAITNEADLTVKGGIDNEGTLINNAKIASDNYLYNGADGAFTNNGELTISNLEDVAIYNEGVITSGADAKYTLTNNTADDGAALYNDGGNATIANATFESNTATTGNGGAIYNRGTLTVKDSVFGNETDETKGNHADAIGGGAIYNVGTLTVDNSSFYDNTAKYFGAIRDKVEGFGVTIKDSTFIDNTAEETGAVGVFSRNGASSVSGSLFSGNEATATGAGVDGTGALFVGAEANLTVSNSQFIDNTSAQQAGAIGTRSFDQGNNTASKLDITGSLFSGNTAATEGGAINNYLYNDAAGDGYVKVTDSTFVENTAANGGAVFNHKGDTQTGNIYFGDSNFVDNTATTAGGAIYNEGVVTVAANTANVEFSGNTANGVANDIYNTGTLNLNTASGKIISLEGGIDGSAGTVNIAGNVETSTIKNQTVALTAGELHLADGAADGSNLAGSTVTVASGAAINSIDETINDYTGAITLASGAVIKGDIDFENGVADTYSSDAGSVNYRVGNLIGAVAKGEKTIQVASEGTTVSDSGYAWFNAADGLVLTSSGAADGKVKITGLSGGIEEAADASASVPTIDYDFSADESINTEKAFQDNFNLNGDGASTLTLNADVTVTSGAVLNANDMIFDGTGTMKTARGSETHVKDSEFFVDIENNGVWVSDPTTYWGTVTNNTTASYDNDTFETTSALVNNDTAFFENDVTFKGTSITGQGDLYLGSGTTAFQTTGGTVNDNDIYLASGAKFSGKIVGGSFDSMNNAIDTGLGTIENADLYIDANLSGTGSADAFAGTNGSKIKEITILGNDYNAGTDELKIAVGGATLDSNVAIYGANYYTSVTKDSSGNLVFSDKLINTSTLRGTDAAGETVTIADKAEITNIGTANAKVALNDAAKTATITAANGLIVTDGTNTATLTATTTGLDVAEGLTVGGNAVLTTNDVGPAYTGSTLSDATTYVATNGTKIANVATTAGLVTTLLDDKQNWVSQEFGYNTKLTDADTVLTAAGYSDQNSDGKVGFLDAFTETKTKTTVATAGNYIAAGDDVKANLGLLDTAVKNSSDDVADIRTALGIADGDTDTTITGAKNITDNTTFKGALTELDTAIGNRNYVTSGGYTGTLLADGQDVATSVLNIANNMVSLTDDNVFTGVNTFKNASGIAIKDAFDNITTLKTEVSGSDTLLTVSSTVNAAGLKLGTNTVTSIDVNGSGVGPTSGGSDKVMATAATVYNGAEKGLYTGSMVTGTATGTYTIKDAIDATTDALNAVLTSGGNEIDSAKVDVQWNSGDSTLKTVLGTGAYTNENNVTSGQSITASIDALDTAVGDVSTLTTTATDVVGAINEVVGDITVGAGTYNYIAAGADVAGNLVALDAQVKSNSDSLAVVGTPQTSVATSGLLDTFAINGNGGSTDITLIDAVDTIAHNAAGLSLDNTFSGNNTFTGTTQFNGATNTFGATAGSQVVIDNGGNITVDGNTTTGTLTVGSANAISSTSAGVLNMNNSLTGIVDLTMTGDASIGGDLGVTGDATVGGDLGVTGTATVGALAIGTTGYGINGSGAATLGATTVDSLNIGTTGSGFDASGKLKVGAANAITGTATSLDINGNDLVNIKDLATTGDASIGGDLGVTGDAVVAGDFAVAGDTVLADTTVGGDLSVAGDTSLADTTVTGTLTVTDGITANTFAMQGKTVTVDGNTEHVLQANGDVLSTGIVAAADGLIVAKLTGTDTYSVVFDVDDNGSIVSDMFNTDNVNNTVTIGKTAASATDVIGDFTLNGTTGSGYAVNDIDGTGLARGVAGVANTLATSTSVVATIAAQAEDATYTNGIATGSNITTATLGGAIGELDAAIGSRTYTNQYNITNADDVTTSLDDLDTVIGDFGSIANANGNLGGADISADLDALDVAIGTRTYTNDYNVTDGDDLTTSIDDIDAAIGDRSAYTSGFNITANDDVATSLDDIDLAIGDRSAYTSGFNITANDDVATSLDDIDLAIGDRSAIGSLNTSINTGTATDVATGLKAAGDAIGDQAFTDPAAVSYGTITANTDLTTVAAQLNHNIGTTAVANAQGNLAGATSTVNQNLDALDVAIGDRSQLGQSNYMAANETIVEGMMDLDHNLKRVEKEMRGGFASMAAMSALVPNGRAAGNTQVSVGVGAYRDHQGIAIGGFHYFNDNILANVGASYGGDKSTVFRAGVTFGW